MSIPPQPSQPQPLQPQLPQPEPQQSHTGQIRGLLSHGAGRCVHYHSELDVLGNLCGRCQQYYACYQCHEALTEHPFQRIAKDHPAGLCCGVCQTTFSYLEYASGAAAGDEASFSPACPHCRAPMNPGCQLHADLYYLPESGER